jgi:chemotaxis protein methyltransferase CheR
MDIALSEIEFNRLRERVYDLTGIKLGDGKRHMLHSRLARRLRKLDLTSFQDYYDLLVGPNSKEEITAFINAVTTNKTDFYRESHHFDFITKQVLPEIRMRSKGRNRSFRVWHAGCSSGEEAYTLSIELHEALACEHGWTVKQLATDIDSNVIEHAVRGTYEIEKLDPVPPELRRRYFLRGTGESDGKAQAKPILSEWLTFRRLNLLDDPWPFSAGTQFEVIFCRNVMIYFDKPTQKKLVSRFCRLLSPSGYLFIGHSESLFGMGDGLGSLGRTIYQKVPIAEAA